MSTAEKLAFDIPERQSNIVCSISLIIRDTIRLLKNNVNRKQNVYDVIYFSKDINNAVLRRRSLHYLLALFRKTENKFNKVSAKKYDPNVTRYASLTLPSMFRLRYLISSRSLAFQARVTVHCARRRHEIETSASFPEAAASSLCRRETLSRLRSVLSFSLSAKGAPQPTR